MSSSYQQPELSRFPAAVYLELPGYTAQQQAVQSEPNFDIFSIFKNKFATTFNSFEQTPVSAVPLQQSPNQPRYLCRPNPDYQVPVTSYVSQVQPYQPNPTQSQPIVYRLPLQNGGGEKFNIFSKIKSQYVFEMF